MKKNKPEDIKLVPPPAGEKEKTPEEIIAVLRSGIMIQNEILRQIVTWLNTGATLTANKRGSVACQNGVLQGVNVAFHDVSVNANKAGQ